MYPITTEKLRKNPFKNQISIGEQYRMTCLRCDWIWAQHSSKRLLTEGWKLRQPKCEISDVIQMEGMVHINTTLCIDHIHMSVTHRASFPCDFSLLTFILVLFWFFVYIHLLILHKYKFGTLPITIILWVKGLTWGMKHIGKLNRMLKQRSKIRKRISDNVKAKIQDKEAHLRWC
jgi:hypothetical protein